MPRHHRSKHNHPQNNPPRFFLSILSAVIVGVGIAYGGIFMVRATSHTASHLVSQTDSQTDSQTVSQTNPRSSLKKNTSHQSLPQNINEEGDEDPTFISRFSRVFKYSAETGVEDFEETSLSATVNPSISALAYSVTSIDKGNTLVEKDADRLLPIASVTKLVTAVVAKKLLGEGETVEITSRMLSTEGNTGRLRLGEKFKVKEILYPLLMVSSNDAAEALLESYDTLYGRGKFVKEMNNWTSSIGAYRTYFRDSSGLSPDNISTARDISIIAKWIKENDPNIFDITLTKTKNLRAHTWTNPAHFLNLSSYDGGKNGYTAEAGLTNLSLFSFGSPKRYYSVVLLGSKQRDADTLAVLNKALK